MIKMFKIVKLIGKIILTPKEAASSYILGDYNMRAMKYFIALISVLFWLELLFLDYRYENIFAVLIVSLVILPFISLFINKVIILFYANIFNSGLNYKIPYDTMQKLISPYYAATIIISMMLTLVGQYIILIQDYKSIFLLLWFNLQMYYIIIYRIAFQKANTTNINILLKKFLYCIIILLVVRFGIVNLNNQGVFSSLRERPMLNYQNPEIRVEVYEECKEIFDEVEIFMQIEDKIPSNIHSRMISKLHSLVSEKIHYVRTNEGELMSAVLEMSRLYEELFIVRRTGNEVDKEVKIHDIMCKYQEEVEKAKKIMDLYLEQNN